MTNQDNYKKLTENKGEVSFFLGKGSKQKLNPSSYKLEPSTLTIKDFGKLIVFKCGGVNAFAKRLGVTRGRGSQIAHGVDLPTSPKSITKIADILQIDIVVLTQLFSRVKNSQTLNIPQENGKGKNDGTCEEISSERDTGTNARQEPIIPMPTGITTGEGSKAKADTTPHDYQKLNEVMENEQN